MYKIAIIGATEIAKNYALHAKKMGIATICFAWDKGAVAKDHVDMFYPISIFETEEILRICTNEKIDGVVATTELTIPIATFIANRMGLNGNDQFVMDHITSKVWVREKCAQGIIIKQPSFSVLNELNEPDRTSLPKFPVIVKPVAEGGKRGVSVAYDKEQFDNAIQYAFQADQRHRGVLVEAFLQGGMECSVESLSYHGSHQIIQVTQKISSGPPHCVELGHIQPAMIPAEIRGKIENAVAEVLKLTGIQNGPCHTEVKIIGNEVYLIELNARVGGDGISFPLTMLSTGYDYISETIKVAIGLPPSIKNAETHARYAGMRYVTEQTSYLTKVFENCNGEKWLYEKYKAVDELCELTHNDWQNTNHFVYVSEEPLVFPGEEKYLPGSYTSKAQ